MKRQSIEYVTGGSQEKMIKGDVSPYITFWGKKGKELSELLVDIPEEFHEFATTIYNKKFAK